MDRKVSTSMAQVAMPEQATAQITGDFLTVREVARLFRVDSTTVRRWVKQGALEAVLLPGIGPNRKYRIKRETVEKVLNS